MPAGKPILVTGSHRSGSTWTGRMLALAEPVVYIQEPFNSDYFHPGICGARFHYRFTYVTHANEAQWRAAFARTIGLHYNLPAALTAAPGDWRAKFSEARRFRAARQAGYRALLKDPLALLSAGWLAERFDAAVVVLIRHPAAFAASVKRFGWHSPVGELLEQRQLVEDYLAPLEHQARLYAAPDTDIVDQAAMFWTLLYHVVRCYQQEHPYWLYLRHEDLSAAPVARFEQLYAALDLPFTPPVAQMIEAYTGAENPAEAPAHSTVVRLDSRANVNAWKGRLQSDEVARIRSITASVADHFYGPDEW